MRRWEPVLALRPGIELDLGALSPGLQAGLAALGNGGATADEVADAAHAAEPSLPLAHVYFRLDRLARRGLLSASATAGGRMLMRAVPLRLGARLATVDLEDDVAVRLSRFAYCRRRGDELVLESPLADFRVELLSDEAAAAVAALAVPHSAGESDAACIALLRATGIASPADEDADEALAVTEFHDLLYHRRSRRGWSDDPIGATFLHLGSIPPQPALRPRHDGPTLALPKPDLTSLVDDDVPFTRVLETRRSVRAYDEEHPPDVATLGEFLYRVARVRALFPADPDAGVPYETSSRPYPSGGATYDLELYLTIRACDGAEPGIYHYEPDTHALTLVTEDRGHVDALLREAWIACGQQVVPQVLITLASRFGRLSWKYSGMAYSATLKNVGVLYQTMYLVATAMGLAPCALGNGDSALFAEATGIDPAAESSVGEFMLGTLPPG